MSMPIKPLLSQSIELKNNSSYTFHLVTSLCINIFLLISASYMFFDSSLYIFSQLLFPILFFRSFALFHDATHNTIHKNSTLNDLMGFFTSIFCFVPYWPWRLIHLQHHKWTGHIEKDPVLLILRTHPNLSTKKKNKLNYVWKSWIPAIALAQHLVFWKMGHVYFKKSETLSDKFKCVLSYAVLIASYGTLLFSLGLKGTLAMVPAIVFYLIATELINVPHHLSLNTNTNNTPSSPIHQHKYCRSCHHNIFISFFILCNFNLHTEHHMYPYLPWFQLHKIKDSTTKHLKGSYNKSDGIAWLIKNRKKKFGDVIYGPQEDQQTEAA